jgi:hypothetical protein
MTIEYEGTCRAPCSVRCLLFGCPYRRPVEKETK